MRQGVLIAGMYRSLGMGREEMGGQYWVVLRRK